QSLRLVEARQGRLQETLGLFRRRELAIEQELSDDRRDAQAARERIDGGGVVRPQMPAFDVGAHGCASDSLAKPSTGIIPAIWRRVRVGATMEQDSYPGSPVF